MGPAGHVLAPETIFRGPAWRCSTGEWEAFLDGLIHILLDRQRTQHLLQELLHTFEVLLCLFLELCYCSLLGASRVRLDALRSIALTSFLFLLLLSI